MSLIGTLFTTALIALLATTSLYAGLAMTRAAVHRAASRYGTGAYQAAVQSVQHAIAAQMSSGAPLPSFSPAPPQCADADCRYRAGVTIAYAPAATPAPGVSCDPQQSNCAYREQANAYVDEGRVTARVAVTVTDPNSGVLAQRSGDVTFRTLHAPPYAVLAGARDDAFDAAAGDTSGDDGGMAPATPAPCASAPAGSSDDTTVRVAYENAISGACTDGSSWRDAPYSQAPAAPQGWSP